MLQDKSNKLLMNGGDFSGLRKSYSKTKNVESHHNYIWGGNKLDKTGIFFSIFFLLKFFFISNPFLFLMPMTSYFT